jgi:hypothetical protein
MRCQLGLDTVELLWEVESRFSIEISDADAATCRRVGQLNSVVPRLVAERSSIAQRRRIIPEPDLSWPRLVEIVIHQSQSGAPAERIHPDAEWGRDFGLD